MALKLFAPGGAEPSEEFFRYLEKERGYSGNEAMMTMIVAILSSVLLGAINGFVVIWSGLPSFIVTLGTMLAYRGIARFIGGSDFAKFTAERPFLFDLLNGPMTSVNALFAQGTGLRVSVMLHLPALVWSRDIVKVFNAVAKIGMAVRGLYGEGTQATGDFYQISNATCLGRSEEDFCQNIDRVIRIRTGETDESAL